MTETTDTDTTTERMRALAQYVGETMNREAEFDPNDWEPGDEIPDAIREELGSDFNTMTEEDQKDALGLAVESWREHESGGVLDIRVEASLVDGSLIVNRVILVLDTGGPHVEVALDDRGRGEVTTYDWFGAGRTTYPVSIGGHPLMGVVEYAIEACGSQ